MPTGKLALFSTVVTAIRLPTADENAIVTKQVTVAVYPYGSVDEGGGLVGTPTAIDLYDDEDGAVAGDNPFTTDAYGTVFFYADASFYGVRYHAQITASGVTTRRLVVPASPVLGGEPHVSVLDYGAEGDGATDDTAAFQAALNRAAGGYLYIPKPASPYKYLVNILDIPSGTKVFIQSGTILESCSVTDYGSIFRMFNKTDILIGGYGAILQMHASDYTAGPTHGRCLYIKHSKRIRVEGITCRFAVFDGFYIGSSGGDYDTWSEDIVLRHCTGDTNGRTGFAIITGKRVTLEECVGSNNVQSVVDTVTQPGSGIHIEPDHPDEFAQGIRILNCRTYGNEGRGVSVGLGALCDTDVTHPNNYGPVNVLVEGQYSYEDLGGFGVAPIDCHANALHGIIEARNCVWEKNDYDGGYIQNKDVNGPLVVVRNCLCLNGNELSHVLERVGGLEIVRETGQTGALKIGGVVIEGLRVQDTRDTPKMLRGVHVQDISGEPLWVEVDCVMRVAGPVPGVPGDPTHTVEAVGHSLTVDTPIQFTGTGGGVAAATTYYVVTVVDADNFQFGDTRRGSVFLITAVGADEANQFQPFSDGFCKDVILKDPVEFLGIPSGGEVHWYTSGELLDAHGVLVLPMLNTDHYSVGVEDVKSIWHNGDCNDDKTCYLAKCPPDAAMVGFQVRANYHLTIQPDATDSIAGWGEVGMGIVAWSVGATVFLKKTDWDTWTVVHMTGEWEPEAIQLDDANQVLVGSSCERRFNTSQYSGAHEVTLPATNPYDGEIWIYNDSIYPVTVKCTSPDTIYPNNAYTQAVSSVQGSFIRLRPKASNRWNVHVQVGTWVWS